jgi:hypothetical protein
MFIAVPELISDLRHESFLTFMFSMAEFIKIEYPVFNS